MKKVDIMLNGVEFPEDFQPPESFERDNYSKDMKCKLCPFYFPGEDWVDHFCCLDKLNIGYDHQCPIYNYFKE